jgi:hypothetical protein
VIVEPVLPIFTCLVPVVLPILPYLVTLSLPVLAHLAPVAVRALFRPAFPCQSVVKFLAEILKRTLGWTLADSRTTVA